MDSKKIQRTAFIKISILIFLVVISVVGIIYFNSAENTSKKKLIKFKNETLSMQSRISSLDKQKLKFANSLEIWESMKEKQKKLAGLRISEANHALSILEKKYNIVDLKTVFSKPTSIKKGINSKLVKIISSNSSISFRALTDSHVFQFLDGIQKNFPGYIQVKSINISTEGRVGKDFLRNLSLGHKGSLVYAVIEIIWRDLKYIDQ